MPLQSPGPPSAHPAPGLLTRPRSAHMTPGRPKPQPALPSRLQPLSPGLPRAPMAPARSVLQALYLTLHINYSYAKERLTSSSRENNKRKHPITYLRLAKPASSFHYSSSTSDTEQYYYGGTPLSLGGPKSC